MLDCEFTNPGFSVYYVTRAAGSIREVRLRSMLRTSRGYHLQDKSLFSLFDAPLITVGLKEIPTALKSDSIYLYVDLI